MILRKKILLLLLLNCFLFNLAQTSRKSDSLRTAYLNSRSDSSKALTLCEYAKSLVQYKPDTAFILAEQAYNLAHDMNFKWGEAHAFYAMGVVKNAETKYADALNYYNKALDLFKQFDNTKVLASIYNNIGLVHLAAGDSPNALLNFHTAIKLYKKINFVLGEATTIGNIGLVYYNDGNYAKSLEYDSIGLMLDRQINNQTGIARRIGSMGNAYMFLASDYKRKGMTKEMDVMYGKAVEYLTFAYEENRKMGNKEGMALHIGNMANLYYDMGNLEKTMEYYHKALAMCEESKDKICMSRQYGNMGWIFYEAKEYKKAIEYTEKAIGLLEGLSDIKLQHNWYDNITGMYEAIGDFKSAYYAYQKFVLLRDSLFNIDKARKTLEAQMNIEFERKEESAKQEQARQRLIRNAFIGGFILMLIMAIIVFRSYRIKQKANKLVSKQKELLQEKNKEITDSIHYAKRIQNAHLPSKEYISKKMNELKPKG